MLGAVYSPRCRVKPLSLEGFGESVVRKLRLFSPTYGVIFEVDTIQTTPEDEPSVLSPFNPRPLKESELRSLKETGRLGFYPDQLLLVGEAVDRKLAEVFCRIVAEFEKANSVRIKAFKDVNGNVTNTMKIWVVPGPVVRAILEVAVGGGWRLAEKVVYEMALSYVARGWRRKKWVRRGAKKLAKRVVLRIRKVLQLEGVQPPALLRVGT